MKLLYLECELGYFDASNSSVALAVLLPIQLYESCKCYGMHRYRDLRLMSIGGGADEVGFWTKYVSPVENC